MNIELIRAALEWAKNGKGRKPLADGEAASPDGDGAARNGNKVDAVASGEGEPREVMTDGGSEESLTKTKGS